MGYRLDEIDKHILHYLARDARGTSAPEIADAVDVSPGTIRNRIRQLEAANVIRGYHADIDYERSEGLITNLFVCNTPISERDVLAQQVLKIPGVTNVRELMAGRGNLQVVAVGADTEDVTRIARDLANLGLEIEDEALLQREHFAPYQSYGPDAEDTRPHVADLTTLAGGAEVVDLTVSKGAPITEITLAEANETGLLDDDVLVVAIERGDTIITPKGQTTIEAGDVVSVFSREGVESDVTRAFISDATLA